MRYTKKQAHILANLDRIAEIPEKYSTQKRFELDGKDCTQQVTSLRVQKKLYLLPDGAFARLSGQQGVA